MSDEEYADMENQVQRIAWGWNTSKSETTSLSPFEIMTGCKPISSIERLLKNVPSEIDVPATQTAAGKYIELAKKHADAERTRTAEYMNQRGQAERASIIERIIAIHPGQRDHGQVL